MSPSPQRRRFIGILAACSTLGTLPWATREAIAKPIVTKPETWRGIALGADAQLRIYHPDRHFAQDLIRRSITEVHRLERVFSLYRNDSALSRLNRDGRLDNAPTDMLRLLDLSSHISTLTGGAFDPSVQPLWNLYTQNPNEAAALAPDPQALARALALVNHTAIHIEGRNVRLAKPGMALTLNGIAQGYITDRVTELLRDAGLDRALVDMGETRGLDLLQPTAAWQVGLADPENPQHTLHTIALDNQAIATSGGYGTPLDRSGQITHLFDPHTGQASPRYRSVSVMAPQAATADALSTAFSVMTQDAIQGVIHHERVSAWLLPPGENQLLYLS